MKEYIYLYALNKLELNFAFQSAFSDLNMFFFIRSNLYSFK